MQLFYQSPERLVRRIQGGLGPHPSAEPDEINTHYGITFTFKRAHAAGRGRRSRHRDQRRPRSDRCRGKRDAKTSRLAGMRARLLVVAGPRARQRSARRAAAGPGAEKRAAGSPRLPRTRRRTTSCAKRSGMRPQRRFGWPSLSLRQRAEASAWIEQGLNAPAAIGNQSWPLATAYGNRGRHLCGHVPRPRRTCGDLQAQSVESLERSLAINKWLRNKVRSAAQLAWNRCSAEPPAAFLRPTRRLTRTERGRGRGLAGRHFLPSATH